MMAETLLHTNRRAAGVLSAVAALVPVLGIGMALWAASKQRPILAWAGLLVVLAGAWFLGRQLLLLVPPRLAITRDHLLVYLRGLFPWRVPLNAVECFFIGQGPTRIRVRHPTGGGAENVTVVVRLAENAKAWHDRPADPQRGHWKDGYITIQGAWCEPLDGEVVNRMNHRLAEIKRACRATQRGQVTQ